MCAQIVEFEQLSVSLLLFLNMEDTQASSHLQSGMQAASCSPIYWCCCFNHSSSSWSFAGMTSSSPGLSVPSMAFFNNPYALSRSSLTMIQSWAPFCLAYSISVAAMVNLFLTESSVSVPLPTSLCFSVEKEGGEMKMKMGFKEGWLALMILTPCASMSRMARRAAVEPSGPLMPSAETLATALAVVP